MRNQPGAPSGDIDDERVESMNRQKGMAAADSAALKALRDQLGRQSRAGVVLYLGDQIVPFGDQLWLVPVPALWAL